MKIKAYIFCLIFTFFCNLLFANIEPKIMKKNTPETYFDAISSSYRWHDWLVSLGSAYYFSRYPKLLGVGLLLNPLLSPFADEGSGSEYIFLPPATYNLFLPKNDVGPEGRPEVFLTNVALMTAGHFTYKWLSKTNNQNTKSKSFSITPILLSDYQGVVLTTSF